MSIQALGVRNTCFFARWVDAVLPFEYYSRQVITGKGYFFVFFRGWRDGFEWSDIHKPRGFATDRRGIPRLCKPTRSPFSRLRGLRVNRSERERKTRRLAPLGMTGLGGRRECCQDQTAKKDGCRRIDQTADSSPALRAGFGMTCTGSWSCWLRRATAKTAPF